VEVRVAEISPRAARLGSYPSSAAATKTRARVFSRTVRGAVSDRDTVATETPARAATACMLAGTGAFLDL
jgi:hypothetical protein